MKRHRYRFCCFVGFLTPRIAIEGGYKGRREEQPESPGGEARRDSAGSRGLSRNPVQGTEDSIQYLGGVATDMEYDTKSNGIVGGYELQVSLLT